MISSKQNFYHSSKISHCDMKSFVLILIRLLGIYLFIFDFLFIFIVILLGSPLFLVKAMLFLSVPNVLGIHQPEYYVIYPYVLIIYYIVYSLYIYLFKVKQQLKWLIVIIVFGLIYWLAMFILQPPSTYT